VRTASSGWRSGMPARTCCKAVRITATHRQRCVIHKILVRVSRRPELDLQGMMLAAAQQMIAV
jgi:hypothetical protein